ncbi:MAG: rhodanese-like domain-containing protein [Clostridiaceae bacterium]
MKKILIVPFLVMLIALTGCQSVEKNVDPEIKGIVNKISAEDAKKKMDEDKSIILVDVRTKEEYDEAHIENAVLLTLDTINAMAPSLIPDKNATYFVYCRSGSRSAIAASELVIMGYMNIYDMGGIADWPYETVQGK